MVKEWRAELVDRLNARGHRPIVQGNKTDGPTLVHRGVRLVQLVGPPGVGKSLRASQVLQGVLDPTGSNTAANLPYKRPTANLKLRTPEASPAPYFAHVDLHGISSQDLAISRILAAAGIFLQASHGCSWQNALASLATRISDLQDTQEVDLVMVVLADGLDALPPSFCSSVLTDLSTLPSLLVVTTSWYEISCAVSPTLLHDSQGQQNAGPHVQQPGSDGGGSVASSAGNSSWGSSTPPTGSLGGSGATAPIESATASRNAGRVVHKVAGASPSGQGSGQEGPGVPSGADAAVSLGPGSVVIDVKPLSVDDSWQLFCSLAPDMLQPPKGAQQQQEALREVVEACAGNAACIGLVARLAEEGMAEPHLMLQRLHAAALRVLASAQNLGSGAQAVLERADPQGAGDPDRGDSDHAELAVEGYRMAVELHTELLHACTEEALSNLPEAQLRLLHALGSLQAAVPASTACSVLAIAEARAWRRTTGNPLFAVDSAAVAAAAAAVAAASESEPDALSEGDQAASSPRKVTRASRATGAAPAMPTAATHQLLARLIRFGLIQHVRLPNATAPPPAAPAQPKMPASAASAYSGGSAGSGSDSAAVVYMPAHVVWGLSALLSSAAGQAKGGISLRHDEERTAARAQQRALRAVLQGLSEGVREAGLLYYGGQELDAARALYLQEGALVAVVRQLGSAVAAATVAAGGSSRRAQEAAIAVTGLAGHGGLYDVVSGLAEAVVDAWWAVQRFWPAALLRALLAAVYAWAQRDGDVVTEARLSLCSTLLAAHAHAREAQGLALAHVLSEIQALHAAGDSSRNGHSSSSSGVGCGGRHVPPPLLTLPPRSISQYLSAARRAAAVVSEQGGPLARAVAGVMAGQVMSLLVMDPKGHQETEQLATEALAVLHPGDQSADTAVVVADAWVASLSLVAGPPGLITFVSAQARLLQGRARMHMHMHAAAAAAAELGSSALRAALGESHMEAVRATAEHAATLAAAGHHAAAAERCAAALHAARRLKIPPSLLFLSSLHSSQVTALSYCGEVDMVGEAAQQLLAVAIRLLQQAGVWQAAANTRAATAAAADAEFELPPWSTAMAAAQGEAHAEACWGAAQALRALAASAGLLGSCEAAQQLHGLAAALLAHVPGALLAGPPAPASVAGAYGVLPPTASPTLADCLADLRQALQDMSHQLKGGNQGSTPGSSRPPSGAGAPRRVSSSNGTPKTPHPHAHAALQPQQAQLPALALSLLPPLEQLRGALCLVVAGPGHDGQGAPAATAPAVAAALVKLSREQGICQRGCGSLLELVERDCMGCLAGLASSLLGCGELRRAKEVLGCCRRLRLALHGPHHPSLSGVLYLEALAALRSGSPREAERLCRQSLELLQQVPALGGGAGRGCAAAGSCEALDKRIVQGSGEVSTGEVSLQLPSADADSSGSGRELLEPDNQQQPSSHRARVSPEELVALAPLPGAIRLLLAQLLQLLGRPVEAAQLLQAGAMAGRAHAGATAAGAVPMMPLPGAGGAPVLHLSDPLLQGGVMAYHQGRIQEALAVFEAALSGGSGSGEALAEGGAAAAAGPRPHKQPSLERGAWAALYCSLCHSQLGHTERADKLAQDALSLVELRHGKGSLSACRMLDTLAAAALRDGQPAKAEALLRRSVALIGAANSSSAAAQGAGPATAAPGVAPGGAVAASAASDWSLVDALTLLAEAQQRMCQPSTAVQATCERGIALLTRLGCASGGVQAARLRLRLVAAAAAGTAPSRGGADAAAEVLRKEVEGLRALVGEGHPEVAVSEAEAAGTVLAVGQQCCLAVPPAPSIVPPSAAQRALVMAARSVDALRKREAGAGGEAGGEGQAGGDAAAVMAQPGCDAHLAAAQLGLCRAAIACGDLGIAKAAVTASVKWHLQAAVQQLLELQAQHRRAHGSGAPHATVSSPVVQGGINNGREQMDDEASQRQAKEEVCPDDITLHEGNSSGSGDDALDAACAAAAAAAAAGPAASGSDQKALLSLLLCKEPSVVPGGSVPELLARSARLQALYCRAAEALALRGWLAEAQGVPWRQAEHLYSKALKLYCRVPPASRVQPWWDLQVSRLMGAVARCTTHGAAALLPPSLAPCTLPGCTPSPSQPPPSATTPQSCEEDGSSSDPTAQCAPAGPAAAEVSGAAEVNTRQRRADAVALLRRAVVLAAGAASSGPDQVSAMQLRLSLARLLLAAGREPDVREGEAAARSALVTARDGGCTALTCTADCLVTVAGCIAARHGGSRRAADANSPAATAAAQLPAAEGAAGGGSAQPLHEQAEGLGGGVSSEAVVVDVVGQGGSSSNSSSISSSGKEELEEARAMCEEAMATYHQVLGVSDPASTSCQALLAHVIGHGLCCWQQAEPLYVSALDIMSHRLGHGHMGVLDLAYGYASMMIRHGRHRTADNFLTKFIAKAAADVAAGQGASSQGEGAAAGATEPCGAAAAASALAALRQLQETAARAKAPSRSPSCDLQRLATAASVSATATATPVPVTTSPCGSAAATPRMAERQPSVSSAVERTAGSGLFARLRRTLSRQPSFTDMRSSEQQQQSLLQQQQQLQERLQQELQPRMPSASPLPRLAAAPPPPRAQSADASARRPQRSPSPGPNLVSRLLTRVAASLESPLRCRPPSSSFNELPSGSFPAATSPSPPSSSAAALPPSPRPGASSAAKPEKQQRASSPLRLWGGRAAAQPPLADDSSCSDSSPVPLSASGRAGAAAGQVAGLRGAMSPGGTNGRSSGHSSLLASFKQSKQQQLQPLQPAASPSAILAPAVPTSAAPSQQASLSRQASFRGLSATACDGSSQQEHATGGIVTSPPSQPVVQRQASFRRRLYSQNSASNVGVTDSDALVTADTIQLQVNVTTAAQAGVDQQTSIGFEGTGNGGSNAPAAATETAPDDATTGASLARQFSFGAAVAHGGAAVVVVSRSPTAGGASAGGAAPKHSTIASIFMGAGKGVAATDGAGAETPRAAQRQRQGPAKESQGGTEEQAGGEGLLAPASRSGSRTGKLLRRMLSFGKSSAHAHGAEPDASPQETF